VGSHDAMPIASVACTVLHRLGTLPWSSGLMSSRALCRGPRATKHQLLLLTWREEVAVHAAVMPLLFSRSCEKRCITRYDAATQSPKYHVRPFVYRGRCRRGELCMQLPTLFLDNLLHDTKPSKRDPPPTHTEAICGRRCCRADQHYPSHRHPCRRRRPRRRQQSRSARPSRAAPLPCVCVAHGRGVQQGSASEEAVVICLHSACGCSVTARDTDSPMLAGVAGFASCGAEHARAISAYRHGRACSTLRVCTPI
jgi:hypothetical protein